MSGAVRATALAVLLALLLPDAAAACAVCFDPSEESRFAFVATTIFLSVLPLAILLGVGVWLRRKVLDTERRHEQARTHAPHA